MPTPFVAPLFALGGGGSGSATINVGRRRPFLAWTTVTMIDSLIDFDRDNAVAADIFTVDGVRTATRVFAGDHFGPLGSSSNVFAGAVGGSGTRMSFFLRAFNPSDLAASGEAIVLTLD